MFNNPKIHDLSYRSSMKMYPSRHRHLFIVIIGNGTTLCHSLALSPLSLCSPFISFLFFDVGKGIDIISIDSTSNINVQLYKHVKNANHMLSANIFRKILQIMFARTNSDMKMYTCIHATLLLNASSATIGFH